MNPARRLAGASAAVTVAALLSGCSMFSAQTTTLQYTPSDGVQGTFGEIEVRNVLVLAEAEDSPGTMVGSLVNGGSEEVTVTVVGETMSKDVDVPAGEVVTLGPDGDETIDADSVGVVPGRHLRVLFSGGGGSVELQVPVLDGSLPEYADLVPTEAP